MGKTCRLKVNLTYISTDKYLKLDNKNGKILLMKKLTNWIKNKFSPGDDDWTNMSSSIQKMAAESGINRRKNARILYPNTNFSAKLPQIIYNSQPEKAVDISLGGVCLLNDKNQFGLEIGETVELAFRWLNEKDMNLNAKIVGQSYNKVHFQFQDLATDIYVKLSINLKSGMVGRKFQQSMLNENVAIQADYTELWVGLNSERLVFYNNETCYAELSYFGTTVRFYKDKKPEMFNKQGDPMEFGGKHLSDSLILLANIPSPSKAVKELISILENFDAYYRSVG